MPDPRARAAAAADRLTRTIEEVLAEVQQLPPEIIHWVPAAGAWTVMDNLCHIREFVPFWTGEALRIVRSPTELWGRDHTDTARLEAVANTKAHRLDAVVADIRAAVRRSAEALKTLSDEQLTVEALSKNPRWGVKPASFVIDDLLVHHVAKHQAQIRRNVSRFTPLLFPAPPVVAAAVHGRRERLPIRRIFCVGRNYEAHAREMGVAVDREAPFYFTKTAEHYVASASTVPYPPGTTNYHYELELVVVLGAPAFRIAADRALDAVFGYACGLDMTRRDLQFIARDQRRPWDLGKDVEQSAVLSEIVPAAAIGHPAAGRIQLRVNDQIRQDADISQLIHKVPELIAHLSNFYHLQPGDVIYTGTPEGVGPVTPGDTLAGAIEGVGTISLTIGDPL